MTYSTASPSYSAKSTLYSSSCSYSSSQKDIYQPRNKPVCCGSWTRNMRCVGCPNQ
ncbi:TPA: hypothetical protein HA241_05900 [Candidatus Woesearchaeota archaeon]|nr:hypothetical protein [Candidatus Woesearchaeota archaeon]